MSLDLTVSNKRLGDSVDLNWLRNPFGLERWAEGNYRFATKTVRPERETLWYVCNHWAYKPMPRSARQRFNLVVDAYASVLSALDRGYFWFDAADIMQFIVPKLNALPRDDMTFNAHTISARISGQAYHGALLGIPQEHFNTQAWNADDRFWQYHQDEHSLSHYQEWFASLVHAADLLQEPGSTWYCST